MIMYEHYAGFFALYYSLSFSCYFAKIFSMATSFRMTSFAPREAMTTAEPPEPLTFSAFRFFYSNKSFSGLTARRRGILFLPCFQWTTKNSCSFVFIRGSKLTSCIDLLTNKSMKLFSPRIFGGIRRRVSPATIRHQA